MHTPTKCNQCGKETLGVELSTGCISSTCPKCWEELKAATKKAAADDARHIAHAPARKRPR